MVSSSDIVRDSVPGRGLEFDDGIPLSISEVRLSLDTEKEEKKMIKEQLKSLEVS